jgi:hypothetical protein
MFISQKQLAVERSCTELFLKLGHEAQRTRTGSIAWDRSAHRALVILTCRVCRKSVLIHTKSKLFNGDAITHTCTGPGLKRFNIRQQSL